MSNFWNPILLHYDSTGWVVFVNRETGDRYNFQMDLGLFETLYKKYWKKPKTLYNKVRKYAKGID